MEFIDEKNILTYLSHMHPTAIARIRGSKEYPDIRGTVALYQTSWGVYVIHSINGLPYGDNPCGNGVLGFHIHDGKECLGNDQDPFVNAGQHFNPGECAHPFHAGDLPPLFVNDGYAWGAVMTHRFSVKDVVGLTVIVHSKADDFTSQPSGNSGDKIACGVISLVQ